MGKIEKRVRRDGRMETGVESRTGDQTRHTDKNSSNLRIYRFGRCDDISVPKETNNFSESMLCTRNAESRNVGCRVQSAESGQRDKCTGRAGSGRGESGEQGCQNKCKSGAG